MKTQPAEFYQGDRIEWVEPRVDPGATALTVWLRAATAGAGIEAPAVLTGDGWRVTLTAQITAAMAPGAWDLQFISTVDGAPVTTGRGSLTVRKSLAFTGTAGAFDDRSQAQKDLAAIEEAIRQLVGGAQEYQIGSLGSGGRKVVRADLAELIKWRDRLKSEVMREKRAEMIAQGLGDPRRLYVRFGGVN
jgi:hypothetical protein